MKKRVQVAAVVLIGLCFLFLFSACKSNPAGPGGRDWVEVEIRYERTIPIQCSYCEDNVKLWYWIEKPDNVHEYNTVTLSLAKKNVYRANLTVYYDRYNTICIDDARMYEPTLSYRGAVTGNFYVNGTKLTRVVEYHKFIFIVSTQGTVWQP